MLTPAGRVPRLDEITPLRTWPHRRHGRLGMDHGAATFREMQVGEVEAVLRVVPAPDHALAALDAAGALRPGATEVWVGNLPPRRAEEHTDRRELEGVPDTHLVGD